jgi:hypothetical protein
VSEGGREQIGALFALVEEFGVWVLRITGFRVRRRTALDWIDNLWDSVALEQQVGCLLVLKPCPPLPGGRFWKGPQIVQKKGEGKEQ